jgi:hypothetical protein
MWHGTHNRVRGDLINLQIIFRQSHSAPNRSISITCKQVLVIPENDERTSGDSRDATHRSADHLVCIRVKDRDEVSRTTTNNDQCRFTRMREHTREIRLTDACERSAPERGSAWINANRKRFRPGRVADA